MSSESIALPGVIFVRKDERARHVVELGPAAGWFVPAGILKWTEEVVLVAREELTPAIRQSVKLVMPEEQIARAKYPMALRAATNSPLVALGANVAPKLIELGLRVHTVGFDRVTSSFHYLAEGAGEDPVRVGGDLVQAVGAMLGERADNGSIERALDGLVDRLLRMLSRDRVTELTVELAARLPRAAADGSGLRNVDLDGFEARALELLETAGPVQTQAQEVADLLTSTYERRVAVPLFDEARKVSLGPFELLLGDQRFRMPTYERWLMSDGVQGSARPPARPSEPVDGSEDAALAGLVERPLTTPEKAAADKAAADKAAADKAAEDKAKADKAAADKAAADKAAADKAAADKAAADKAAADKAAADKAAADKAAADKAAADKAAADKAAADKAAADKAAADKAAADKAAADKAAADKAAADKAAADKAAADKAAADKAAADKAAADKAAEDKAAADKAAEDKAAEDKAAADKAAEDKAAEDRSANAKGPEKASARSKARAKASVAAEKSPKRSLEVQSKATPPAPTKSTDAVKWTVLLIGIALLLVAYKVFLAK
jgi:hypothetical protein